MTPREPDRFDAQAEELRRRVAAAEHYNDIIAVLAAALRAEHASALDAAEAAFRKWGNDTRDKRDVFEVLADVRRALVPPAAAPAAEPERPCTCGSRDDVHVMTCAKVAWLNSPPTGPFPPPPAAEMEKAEEAEAPDWWQDAINKTAATNREILARAEKAEALLRECATWMRGRLRHMGTGTVERIACETILAKLAARATQPEGEGK